MRLTPLEISGEFFGRLTDMVKEMAKMRRGHTALFAQTCDKIHESSELRLTDPFLGCALLILGKRLLRLDRSNPDHYALLFLDSDDTRRIIKSYHDRTLALPLKDVVERYRCFKVENYLTKNARRGKGL